MNRQGSWWLWASKSPFAWSQCEVAFLLQLKRVLINTSLIYSFPGSAGARVGFFSSENAAPQPLGIRYWRGEHQTKLSGPWCEQGQYLFQRKGKLSQQRQIKCFFFFPFLLSLAVFPLTESYKMILFKATITNWSAWEKLHQILIQLHYCHALFRISGKNSQLHMCGCTF